MQCRKVDVDVVVVVAFSNKFPPCDWSTLSPSLGVGLLVGCVWGCLFHIGGSAQQMDINKENVPLDLSAGTATSHFSSLLLHNGDQFVSIYSSRCYGMDR